MKKRCAIRFCLIWAVGSTCLAADDFDSLRKQVLDLGKLSQTPVVHSAADDSASQTVRPVYYEALPYLGKPTRVFAWLGLPAQRQEKIPGIVLVHGGGGTAYREWVEKWVEHGFAAISIAVEGQTDEHAADGRTWKRHAHPGPPRLGIFEDSDQPLQQQWIYHAVADTILARLLLASLPEVNAEQIGLAGISWGGVVTSTVIGIDDRFAFAIPIYGCGHLFDAENQWGRALGNNQVYREVWDPMVRMQRVKLPVLWLTWLKDGHFPLTSQSACYRAGTGPRMVAVLPDMGHSHVAGWKPPDSYAFAESVVNTGRPWLREISHAQNNSRVEVIFASSRPIERAELWQTADTGYTGTRTWSSIPADVTVRSDSIHLSAELPPGSRAWFFNVHAGDLVASSEFVEALPAAETSK